MNAEHPDRHGAPVGNARTRALRFYAAVAAVVLLSVGVYIVILTNESSGDRASEQSASGGNDGSGTASSNDPSSSGSGQNPSQSPSPPSSDQGRPSASTTSSTRPPNPSDPLQIDGCGAPPYPRTFEGWSGNPDYANVDKVVYFSGPLMNLNRLGYEVSRVSKLGCVSVPLFGANQGDLSALAWSNDGLFTKDQVITAMSRIGMTSIATPACHPDCFK